MSLLLERVRALKREGNDCFNAGNRRYGTDEGNDALQHACVLYGQAIEAVMELEVEMDSAAPVEDIRPCSSTAAEVSRSPTFLPACLAAARHVSTHLARDPATRRTWV